MHRPQDDLVPLHEPFETVLRGFNRQQVLAHLESLDGRISMISADRESALAQVAELSRTLDHLREESRLLAHLRREAEKANEQVERIAQSPIVGASVRIRQIVQLAEEEAAEVQARAEREVAALKARADEEIEARRQRASREAETLLRDTTQRCMQLEEDSKRRCKAVEQEAERKIAQLTERQEQTSRQVSALETTRDKIVAQLAGARELLARELEQLPQATGDQPQHLQAVPIQRGGRSPGEQADESATRQLRTS